MRDLISYSVVDIRRFSDDDIRYFYNYISEDRKKRASSYKFSHDRKLSIVSSYQLERLFMIEGIKKPYNYNVSIMGKPFLLGNNISFSISHSGNFSACAISYKKSVGIDIEDFCYKKRSIKRLKNVSDKNFLDSEIEFIGFNGIDIDKENIKGKNIDIEKNTYKKVDDNSINAIKERFFRVWTFKEAYMKAKGINLMLSMKESFFNTNKTNFIQKNNGEAILSIYFCDI